MQQFIESITKSLSGVNLLNAGITFISVFLGAFFAYKYNLRIEKKKAKRQIRGDFCALSTQMYLNLKNMLLFKKLYLSRVKEAFNKQEGELLHTVFRRPDMSFSFDMGKYVFLTNCNRCFLTELEAIKISNVHLQELWSIYEKTIIDLVILLRKKDSKAIEIAKTSFNSFDSFYTQFCICLYNLNIQLSECYKRFFNTNYYDLAQDDKELEKIVKECIPNVLENENFVKTKELFKNSWMPRRTIWRDIGYTYRKTKHHLKWILLYIFDIRKHS